jgi:tetratricopeptide (TPR) repeat protein
MSFFGLFGGPNIRKLIAKRDVNGLTRALNKAIKSGDRGAEATYLQAIGRVYYELKQLDKTIEHYKRSLAVRQALGDRPKEAEMLINIAAVVYETAEMARAYSPGETAQVFLLKPGLEKALSYYERSLPVWKEVGDLTGEMNASWNAAMLHKQIGNLSEAIHLMERVVTIERTTGHPDLRTDLALLKEMQAKKGM